MPPPLVDSPKCPRCSMVGICLPDEINHLALGEGAEPRVRGLVPARDDALPVYVKEAGAHVGKQGEVLVICTRDGEVSEARMNEISQLSVMGSPQVSTQAVQALCGRGIPIAWFSHGGFFYGLTQGIGHKNVELRMRQYRAAFDERASLALARRFVNVKLRNCRTMLRRNLRDLPDGLLGDLKRAAESSLEAPNAQTLLGVEGNGGRLYFGNFAGMLSEKAAQLGFDFTSRNRRPPRDPVNALLSFGYALLTRTGP